MYKLHDHDTLTQDSGLLFMYVSDKMIPNIYILKNKDCLSKYYFYFILKSFIIDDTK